MMTVIDVANWVYLNQRGDAFNGWDLGEICCHLLECIEENTMLVSQDKMGRINGVCTASIYHPNVMHVTNILTTGHGVVKEFMNYFMTRFPGYELEALRRGKIVKYNTEKLAKKYGRNLSAKNSRTAVT